MHFDGSLAAMALALFAATWLASMLGKFGFPVPSGNRIGHVDGLRGYLALAVMLHHFTMWIGIKAGLPVAPPTDNFYNQLGKGAVAIFFMATGLLFYPKILKGFRENDWLSVYNGRVFRIVPMIFFSTLACAAILAVEHNAVPDWKFPIEVARWISGGQVPLMGTPESALVNSGVLWSIRWEWYFYFGALPALSILRLLVKRDWFVGVLAALFALALIGRAQTSGPVAGVFQFMPLFILGMLTGEVIARPQLAALAARRWMAVPAIAALALGMTQFHDPYGLPAMLLFGFVFMCVACGNDLFGLLSTRGARVLGELSFSIYVLHGIALYLAFRLLPVEGMPVIALPLLVAGVTLLSAATFLGIEAPGIQLGRQVLGLLRFRAIRVVPAGASRVAQTPAARHFWGAPSGG